MSPESETFHLFDSLRTYLTTHFGAPVTLVGIAPLGEPIKPGLTELKGYGYGQALRIEFQVGSEKRQTVLHTIKPGPFGHEEMPDRAGELLWCHRAFNTLPRHVRSLDVGGVSVDGHYTSLGRVEEFFLLTDYVPGHEYADDLARIQREGKLSGLDTARADALCDYLLEIHGTRGNEPSFYTRRIRELLGHSQCIMGLADSYPTDDRVFTPAVLESIESRVVSWRWRIKPRTHRLRRVHGDFHPWNILFEKETNLHVLDRSRGEWGEPADDVTSLTMNYLFMAVQSPGSINGPFRELFRRFWQRYLAGSRDTEMLEVAAPFIVFRALVMSSPVWYPNVADCVRKRMLNLINAVLDQSSFNPERVVEYFGF